MSAVLVVAACHERQAPPTPPPADLDQQCNDEVGSPRVEKISERVAVARGFDLANTTAIKTGAGLVVVDPGMTSERAAEVKAALATAGFGGPVAAVIYTHSHIDHVGGARAFVDGQSLPPAIWATDAFIPHLHKQYGDFRPAEARRGARQFGHLLDDEAVPCISIGRRIDLEGALSTGLRLPDHTFSGERTLTLGGVRIDLVEAHGETHDQLFVWLPDDKVLLPGDNYYAAFPNLYTIRGTSRRPVDQWVKSLDAMRRRQAEVLIPSHTSVVRGADAIADRLTAYRDAIRFVYDHVVRGANAGASLDAIVESLKLPAHLANRPDLQPLYGEPSWSARGIYTGALGWFDGEAEALYPLARRQAAALDVELMGNDALRARAETLLNEKKPAEALHLLKKLRDAGLDDDQSVALRARALRAQAAKTVNTNGRAYLLSVATEIEAGGPPDLDQPVVDDVLLDSLPIDVFFLPMPHRLKAEAAADVQMTVAWQFTDEDRRFWVTVRRGVAEVAEGTPLPGTGEPVAAVKTTTHRWKRLALRLDRPTSALLSDDFTIEGDRLALGRFLTLFERGF